MTNTPDSESILDDEETRLQLSRRSALTLTALLTGAITVKDALQGDVPASAAIYWKHPFTFRASIPSGGRFRDRGGAHEGLDLSAGDGTVIYSVAPGTVVYSGSNSGWGEYVRVSHPDGYQSLYAHMRSGTRIAQGASVAMSEPIGRVGLTGRTYGYHLHIEIRRNGTLQDPYPFIYNAPLASEDIMTPEQEKLLKQVASNVAWLKKRIGGSVNDEPVGNKVGWLKKRIGGSISNPTITDILT